ncbi:MAG: nucleoside deaminase [Micromonosporaceae bacterium]|nr:nucleoside deaminase [Micromonosporaceae bacterium]
MGLGRLARHEQLVRRALEVAVEGHDDRLPDEVDVPVGAVVFGPDGAELATGRNERSLCSDPTAHAEIVAIRRAAAVLGSWRLDDCTLAVTLEPCTMCAGAIVLARIAVLVFGAWEPKTGAVGSLWDVVRDRRQTHRPEVYGGVLGEECGATLRVFFSDRRDPRGPSKG